MHRKMVKSNLISGLTSGGHIRPGQDMAGYENVAGFRPGPGPDMISGATLVLSVQLVVNTRYVWILVCMQLVLWCWYRSAVNVPDVIALLASCVIRRWRISRRCNKVSIQTFTNEDDQRLHYDHQLYGRETFRQCAAK